MDSSLTKRTLNSVAWTYLSYGLSKAMVLVTTAVLTRLLTKADFGIIGFAVTTMSFLDAVRDLGLGLALIQRRDRVDEAADTVFWISLGSNMLMWLASIAIAPFVADFFHESQITTILPILSFSFVLSSLGGTHDALLQREMKFSRRIIPSLGESLSKGAVSISLALLDGGVWALVAGQMVGRAVFSLLAWRVMAWRPHFRFFPDLARQLFGFGYKIAADSLLSTLQANIDYVFIGRFLGETALGVYTIAFRIPELVIINLCIVIAQVLFPAYATLQEDRDQLRQGMLAALRYIALVTVPAGVGLALVSKVFTRVVFGAEWTDAAPIMAALSVYGALLAVSWNVGDVYKAIGRPDILWKTAVVEFALLAPVLYTLAQRSAFAVSLGHVSVAFVVSTLRLAIAIYLLKLSVRRTLAQFIPSVVGSAVMGAAVWGSLQLTAPLPGVIELGGAMLVGLVSYAGALGWLERDLMGRIYERIGEGLGQGEPEDDGGKSPTPAAAVPEARAFEPTRPVRVSAGPANPPTGGVLPETWAANLARLARKSPAYATLLSRRGELLATIGDLPAPATERVFQIVEQAWREDTASSNALIRSIYLPDLGDFLLYSAVLANGMVLSMVFNEKTSLSTIRRQARRLSQSLSRM